MPLIRVANTGISAVMDSKGVLTRGLALNAGGTIDTIIDVPASRVNWLARYRRYLEMAIFEAFFFLALTAKIVRQIRTR